MEWKRRKLNEIEENEINGNEMKWKRRKLNESEGN